MNMTPEQAMAVNEEGTNIIVSAGAGSGKTAVLTKRIIRKIKSGTDIDHILVLTFTNEAANELKDRIRKVILENNLTDQLNLLESSYITTFDSFAMTIVKKYHYLLNIPSNVSIADSSIINIYKSKVIDEIFESMYGEPNFNKLIDDFCLKDDNTIKNYILSLSSSIELNIDPQAYLSNYLDKYYDENHLNNLLKEYLNLIKKYVIDLESLINDFESHITPKLQEKLYTLINPLIKGNTYEDYLLFNGMEPVRFTGVDESGEELKELIKNKIAEIKYLLRFSNEKDIIKSLISTKEYAKVIIDIIQKLNKKVMDYKNSLNVFEFNDIAHMAIEIVKNNEEVRNELKDFFNEIMIDEYQDTSEIQETFINYISNNNVYTVGDIKQSIYRFRNANPYIFQKKYNCYAKKENGIKIDLLKNFRSRSETLNGINEIFNLIMDEELGDADYLKDHNMVFGNNDYLAEDTHENNNLEIYNYEWSREDEYTREEKEIFIIAEDIIKKINNKYLVFDKNTKCLRPVEYSDFCIITDRNKYFDLYKKILEYKGIPSVLYKDEELVNGLDILVIKNLLALVNYVANNEYSDEFRYAFTSVARSFLFNYSDDQIYQIFNNNSFKQDEIITIAQSINIYMPLNDIINKVIEVYHIYEKIIILPDIEAIITRINNLVDIASSLTSLNYDLSKFVTYLEEAIASNSQLKYTINTKGNNGIKIMNIHKSKGLEFPICYFTGLHNKFTIKELTDKIIFSNTYGIILPYLKDALEDTILKDLYRYEFMKAEISEKIRLYYVSLTRCREKMIIITSISPERSSYGHLVPMEARMRYRSFLDIMNSISVTDKYITNISADYTHEYQISKHKEITEDEKRTKITTKSLDITITKHEDHHFSKETKKLFDLETIKLMELGTNIHEELEYANFKNPTNPHVINLLSQIDNNFINVYKEYEFIYLEDNITYHGVIDLLLEYPDYYNIIDYKLKNISDENYLKQLEGYKNYISSLTNKKVNIYLYSIIDNKLVKLD